MMHGRPASTVPPARLRRLNTCSERAGGEFVLYWMRMYQRAEQNWALTAAIEAANGLGVPLVVHHALVWGEHATERRHRFVLEGAAELGQRFAARGIQYHFLVPRNLAEPVESLAVLAGRAALVLTDDYPTAGVPEASRSAATRLRVPLLAVDGNGIVPLAEIPREQYSAATLRPRLHRLFPAHFRPIPEPDPGKDSLGIALDVPETRVTAATVEQLAATVPTKRPVPPSRVYRGGHQEAQRRLAAFVAGSLRGYAQARHEPGAERTSRLSPYLHLGQISPHQVALAVRAADAAPADRDAFLDELIVRRELAYNLCWHNPRYRSLDPLPAWARQTLAKHLVDVRPVIYRAEEFEAARTHDYLWNAVQAELRATGLMVGYYRMYWGKKILEWSRTPEEAQATMIRLHERYALDGRDPNTYGNILWCLGKHDRPWPERPIYGSVRSMSLRGMETKTDVDSYLDRVRGWCDAAGMSDLLSHAGQTGTRDGRTGDR